MNIMLSNENFSSVIPGLIDEGDFLAERHAQRIAASFYFNDSRIHAIEMRGFKRTREIDDKQGKFVVIQAESVMFKKTINNFLAARGLTGLTKLSYMVPALAQEYSDWLRTYHSKKHKSDYHLINEQNDLNWLYNMCFLGIVWVIVENIREQNAFIDERALMVVNCGVMLQSFRKHAGESPNHNLKHKLDEEERLQATKLMCSTVEEMIKSLASEDLPNYILPSLPPGTPDPLPLPRVTKKETKGQ